MRHRNKRFMINEMDIEQVKTYKYLGVMVPHNPEVECLNQKRSRLAAVRVIASNNVTSGAYVRRVGFKYIAYIYN